MEKRRIPLARSDFEKWLKLNRVGLVAYRESSTGRVGFYKISEGKAQSFKGFEDWQKAKDYLTGNGK